MSNTGLVFSASLCPSKKKHNKTFFYAFSYGKNNNSSLKVLENLRKQIIKQYLNKITLIIWKEDNYTNIFKCLSTIWLNGAIIAMWVQNMNHMLEWSKLGYLMNTNDAAINVANYYSAIL